MRWWARVSAVVTAPPSPSPAAWRISGALAILSTLWLGAGIGTPPTAYWDEGFYVTDAHRFFDGGPLENPEHPPLGKLLIGLAIRLAGDTPFGWRLASLVAIVTLVASLPLWLEPTGLVTSRTPRSILALPSLLLLVDPLVYVTGRIATLDALLCLFYVNAALALVAARNAVGTTHARTLRLAAGVLAGLALGTKWTALTLVPIFGLAHVRMEGKHLRFDARALLDLFGPVAVSYLACFAVPGATHFGLHAFPQIHGPLDDSLSWPERVAVLHYRMVGYHTFYFPSEQRSSWLEWLIARQPLWYSLRPEGDRVRVIAAIGSPLVWITGELATLVTLVCAARERTVTSALLVAFPIAQLAFWALVLRMTFLYYMTAIVPFFALAIAHVIARGIERAAEPAHASRLALGAMATLLAVSLGWHAYVLPLVRGEAIEEGLLREYASSPAAPWLFHDAFPIERVLELARDDAFGAASVE
jgi:predicted membrane-bound dolichyl-phosphate-mannose-protein mannosyltransferase